MYQNEFLQATCYCHYCMEDQQIFLVTVKAGCMNEGLAGMNTSAKIYCHINQYDAIVQYFAILLTGKNCMLAVRGKKTETEKTFTLTIIRKNRHSSRMRQSLQQKKHLVVQNMPIVAWQN